MSEATFGLRTGQTTKPGQGGGLFWSQAHALAFDRLDFAVRSRAPLTVLTGASGSGRSTLLRELLALKRSEISIGLLSASDLQMQDPFEVILKAMGKAPAPDGSEAHAARLERFLDHARSNGSAAVLLMDDADQLAESVLPILAYLIGEEIPAAPRLKLILAGSPDLLQWLKVRLPDLVGPTFELTELSEPDSAAYIRHCLRAEGVDADLFSDEALTYIHKHSGGLPLRINGICQRCLDRAAEEGIERFDVSDVRKSILSVGDPTGMALQQAQPDAAAAPSNLPIGSDSAGRLSRATDKMAAARRTAPASVAQTPPLPGAAPDAMPGDKIRLKSSGRKGLLLGGVAALGLAIVALLGLEGGVAELIAPDAPVAVQTMPVAEQQQVRDRAAEIGAAMAGSPASAEDRFREVIGLAEDNPLLAVVGYARAALMGHDRSAYYLGQIYETGEGVAVDRVLARSWYRQASPTIPSAALLLSNLPMPQAEGPIMAPLPLFGARQGQGWTELVWTSAEGPDPSFYRVEFAAGTDEIVQAVEPVLGSALRISTPVGAAKWRVIAVDAENSTRMASPWMTL